MTKLLTATALLFIFTSQAFTDEGATADPSIGTVSYYKRTLRVEAEPFLKAVGLDRNALHPNYFLAQFEKPVGHGVLAPDSDDGPPFSPMPRIQKALKEFFSSRGVDLSTTTSPSNFIFFNPDTGTLYAQGSLRHVLLVSSIVRQLDGVISKEH